MKMYLKVFLCSLALVGQAIAGTITASWEHPTQNTDGTAIPTSGQNAIVNTRVQYGSCSGDAFGSQLGEKTVAYPAKTVTFTNVNPGDYCVRAFSSSSLKESDSSVVVKKTVAAPPPPTPNPPTMLTVQTTAYELREINSVFKFVSVGTVKRGIPCGSKLVDGYFNVTKDQIKPTKPLQGGALAGKCKAA